MELQDLYPTSNEFSIKSTGKTYVIRPPTLKDKANFAHMFGSDQDALTKVFSEMQWGNICRIVYSLFDQKTKAEFMAEEIEHINDDGVRVKTLVYGYQKLLGALENIDEALKMFGALNKAIVDSEPMAKQFMDEEFKKKIDQIRSQSNLTGEKSMTASPASTDSQLTSSENLPLGSSA